MLNRIFRGETESWLKNRLTNRLQTVFLLLFLTAYPALLGWLLWGGDVVVWLVLFGIVFALFSPVNSPQLVMRFARARLLATSEAPGLHETLRELSLRAGLPAAPQPFYLPTQQMNAFAVGRPQHAAIAVSDGLLRSLERDELAAVLAHEISHLKNDDIRVMSLAALSGRLTAMFSLLGQLLLLFSLPLLLVTNLHINWLALALLIFSPQLSTLAQLGLSRVREYQADISAVELTGDSQALIAALWKIERSSQPFWRRVLPGYQLPTWLRTHPPTAERVRRLQAFAQKTPGSRSSADSVIEIRVNGFPRTEVVTVPVSARRPPQGGRSQRSGF